MTVRERAERYLRTLLEWIDPPVRCDWVPENTDALAAEIQLAVQESYTLGWNEACREAKAFLRPEAYISAQRMAYMNAEKFLLKAECGVTTWTDEFRKELKATYIAQLREAVEDHKCDQVPRCRIVNDNCIYWAKKEAYEDAADITSIYGAQAHKGNCMSIDCEESQRQKILEIMKQIRAKAEELK